MVSLTSALVALVFVMGASSSTPHEYSDALYSFAYAVQDAYTGQDFGHSEERVKDVVTGQYHVLLPDNRVQLVKYKADGYGYVADVSYTDGSYKPAHAGTYSKAKTYPVGGYGTKTGSVAHADAYLAPPGPYQPVPYDLSGYSAYLPAGYGVYLPPVGYGYGHAASYPYVPYPAQYALKHCDH